VQQQATIILPSETIRFRGLDVPYIHSDVA